MRAQAPKPLIVEFTQPDLEPASEAKFPSYECDRCGKQFEGEPAGSGLFIWTRGDEVRLEEPPLCSDCAETVTLDALTRWEVEEEEG